MVKAEDMIKIVDKYLDQIKEMQNDNCFEDRHRIYLLILNILDLHDKGFPNSKERLEKAGVFYFDATINAYNMIKEDQLWFDGTMTQFKTLLLSAKESFENYGVSLEKFKSSTWKLGIGSLVSYTRTTEQKTK